MQTDSALYPQPFVYACAYACIWHVCKKATCTQLVHKRVVLDTCQQFWWAAGVEGVFVDEKQSPLFLIYMEEYLRGVQNTLTEWIARSLKQVRR
jgi:hypothetical protein